MNEKSKSYQDSPSEDILVVRMTVREIKALIYSNIIRPFSPSLTENLPIETLEQRISERLGDCNREERSHLETLNEFLKKQIEIKKRLNSSKKLSI